MLIKYLFSMENRKFEIEGDIESTEEFTEHNEKENTSGKSVYYFLTLFIILFLTISSLFVYYQFYTGNGKWNFSLKKQITPTTDHSNLISENLKLKGVIDSIQQILANNSNDTNTFHEIFNDDYIGETYEVQIGFFKTFDLTKLDKNLVNMNVETSNGSTKLLVGKFTTLDEACKFRKDIEDMGIKGAFIVKKTDGKRVAFEAKCP